MKIFERGEYLTKQTNRGSRRELNMQNYCSLLISKFTNKGNQMKEA